MYDGGDGGGDDGGPGIAGTPGLGGGGWGEGVLMCIVGSQAGGRVEAGECE